MHLAMPKSINLNHAGQTSNVPERHRLKLERTIGPMDYWTIFWTICRTTFWIIVFATHC